MTRLVFMGSPWFAVPVLEALADWPGVEIAGVVTPPDRPSGRGRQSQPPPVKSCALERGTPVFQPDSLRSQAAQQQLAALAADVIVVAAYGKLLPPPVLALPPRGCLNLHPSLLPRHRGPTPVPASILNGDTITGVTLMQLDRGMDTGPIVAQTEYPLTGAETADELTAALFKLGARLLLDNLEIWMDGGLTARPQDATSATVTKRLDRNDGRADWGMSADVLDRRRRAFTPWPGLFTQWEGRTLKLLDSTPLPAPAPADSLPGQVVDGASWGDSLAVVTGDGLLGLERLQLEGRRAVTTREFLAGFPRIKGSVLS